VARYAAASSEIIYGDFNFHSHLGQDSLNTCVGFVVDVNGASESVDYRNLALKRYLTTFSLPQGGSHSDALSGDKIDLHILQVLNGTIYHDGRDGSGAMERRLHRFIFYDRPSKFTVQQ